MVVVPKLTPELFIEAPRRGAAVPNHDGTLALFSQSTHTIGGETLKETRILNIGSGESQQLIKDQKATDVIWLGDGTNAVIYLSPGDEGATRIMIADAGDLSTAAYIADVIDAPVASLKVRYLKDGSVAFAVVGLAHEETGELYNEELNKKPHTARVTERYEPRIWNTYTKPQRHAVWYTTLKEEDGKWKLDKPLKNASLGADIEAPIDLYQPGNPTSEFAIGETGLVFTATKHAIQDPAELLISDVYYLPLDSFSDVSVHGLKQLSTRLDRGLCSSPRFSPDGSIIAFEHAPYTRYLDVSIYVHHLETKDAVDVFTMVTGKKWNLTPQRFEFAPDGHSLYITAADCGRVGLYKLDLQPNAFPKTILRSGSVSAFYALKQEGSGADKILVSSSNLVESSVYLVVDGDLGVESEPWVVSAASQVANLGLSTKQVSEIYFEGAGDYCVQAWVVKPRDFDPSKKYPLCLHVHGGPNGSWDDAWSTRWNPAVWAEQGYIVVAPNVTGSLGFGLDFGEGVNDSWGARPYDDLVNCVDHVRDMPGIDMENAVAAGGSYGGYMMNWIQGHELGRRFKALVCHDGIFHLPSFLLQSDMLSPAAEFGGPALIWKNFDGLERYNPARPDLLKNWKTPMLVIHSDQDYRCPVTDGLGAYHTLKALGTPARFLNFPDEGHWVLKEENSLEWHRQVFDWINKWSGVAAKTGDA